MKIITFEDIKKLEISPKTCFEWVSEMILDKEKTILPPKTHFSLDGGVFCNIMPGIIKTSYGMWGGVKVVNRYPLREPSLSSKLLLMDMDKGKILALMDANWITAMRAGAVAAHSIQYLAKSTYRIIGFMGLGNVARATMSILVSLHPDYEFEIKLLRYKRQEELFVKRFQRFPNLKFTYVNNTYSLVKGTDVIVSAATYLQDDLCPDTAFDEGILVVPIHTRGFTNCDLFFDKVFADDKGHVEHFKYFEQFKNFAEVSEVVNGKKPGRENDYERILAYNIGISIHDINYGYHIYELLKEKPGIFEANMMDPREKFWI